jgi:hypothetical protein
MKSFGICSTLCGLFTIAYFPFAVAGGATSCEEPFVFEGQAANIVPLEYLATVADSESSDTILSEVATKIAWLTELDSWHQPTYGSLGVVAHVYQCEPDDVLRGLLEPADQEGGYPSIRIGQVTVFVQGKIFVRDEKIFIQSRIRAFRRNDRPYEWAYDRDGVYRGRNLSDYMLKDKFTPVLQDLGFVAPIPEIDVVFAPRVLLISELAEIEKQFQRANRVYIRKSKSSKSRPIGFDNIEQMAFSIEAIDEGWMGIRNAFGDGELGYIEVSRDLSSFLHKKLPELDFLNGVLGFLRIRQAADSATGFKQPPSDAQELTLRKLEAFQMAATSSDDVPARALAHALSGVLYASRESTFGDALNHFKQAVDLQPYNNLFHNMLGVMKARICCQQSAADLSNIDFEPRDPSVNFSDSLSIEPNDISALRNLTTYLGRLREMGPLAAKALRLDGNRIEERFSIAIQAMNSLELNKN